MSRLFVTRREVEFINDITKEFVKDIMGQKIIYWPISIMNTKVHDVYDEAINKIFENPIRLDVLAGSPSWETKHNQFGTEQTSRMEVFVQARDLIDKDIQICEGDFFTYDDVVYEIDSYLNLGTIFGLAEYSTGFKLVGIAARVGQFDPKTFFSPVSDGPGPFEELKVQQTFEQQRGLPENVEGTTGDVRQLRERLSDDMPEVALGEGPRKVTTDPDKKGNSFYNDE